MVCYYTSEKQEKNNQMKTNILTIIALTVFMSACEKETTDNKEQSPFPFMQVGNKWTYEWYAEGAAASANIAYEISSIDELGYAAITFTNQMGNTHNQFEWYSSETFFAEESGSLSGFWFPLCYSNSIVGNSWYSAEEHDVLGSITREIMSDNESITVGAGTFTDCIKIKQTYENDAYIVDYFWVNKTVGIVKKTQTAWADINNIPRTYYQITTTLQSKNF